MSHHFGARAARDIGARLVRGYPRPWRGRYEAEVLALLDDASVRWRDVADLARGLLVERMRSTFEPGDRPVVTLTAILMVHVAKIGTMLGAAYALGWTLQSWPGPIPKAVASLAGVVVYLMWGLPRLAWVFRNPSLVYPPYPPRPGAGVWFGVALAVAMASGWSGFPALWAAWLVFLLAPAAGGSFSRMQPAVRQLSACRHELKWALLELERGERLAAEGMTSPLDEARASIERITRSREEALASLHAMGYRAKFRADDTASLGECGRLSNADC